MKTLLDYFQATDGKHKFNSSNCRNRIAFETLPAAAQSSNWLASETRKFHLIFKSKEFRRKFRRTSDYSRFSESIEKPILLLGHTDTVHPLGAKVQNPTRIEDGKFYGGGIFDMKANCVLMLEVLRALIELNLQAKRPITILLSCDEEIGSPTGRALVEREAACGILSGVRTFGKRQSQNRTQRHRKFHFEGARRSRTRRTRTRTRRVGNSGNRPTNRTNSSAQ